MPMTPCEQCHSQGVIRTLFEMGDIGAFLDAMVCPLCGGEGTLAVTAACDNCDERDGELLVRVNEYVVSHWYHPQAQAKLFIKLSVA